MKAKPALQAAQALDALGIALVSHHHHWPKELRRQYETVRRNLLSSAGISVCADVADLAALGSRSFVKRDYKRRQ